MTLSRFAKGSGWVFGFAVCLATAAPPTAPAHERATPKEALFLDGATKVNLPIEKIVPDWDHVQAFFDNRRNILRPEMADWTAWAIMLRREPVLERLRRINTRVNNSIEYVTDAALWSDEDYWEDPAESVRRGQADCEGFAILKMYLGHLAGIDFGDMAVVVGRIDSTGEPHAVLAAKAADESYLLDNRSRSLDDGNDPDNFTALYSVTQQNLWVFPSNLKDSTAAADTDRNRSAATVARDFVDIFGFFTGDDDDEPATAGAANSDESLSLIERVSFPWR